MPAKAECGTYAAYMRHKRKGEQVDEPCAQAARDQKNERMAAKRRAAAEGAKEHVQDQPKRSPRLETLYEIQRTLRGHLEVCEPSSVAAIARELRAVAGEISQLSGESKPVTTESGGVDDLARRREERQKSRRTASEA